MFKINDNNKILIAELIKNACENKISLEEMYEIASGKKDPIGNNPKFSRRLEKNIRVVYSIEQHPSHLMKHISISEDFKLPGLEDVVTILKEFGFERDILDCAVYKEGDVAVNILEPYENN